MTDDEIKTRSDLQRVVAEAERMHGRDWIVSALKIEVLNLDDSFATKQQFGNAAPVQSRQG